MITEFHRFKEQQFAQRPAVVDPLGLAPKTVTVDTETQ